MRWGVLMLAMEKILELVNFICMIVRKEKYLKQMYSVYMISFIIITNAGLPSTSPLNSLARGISAFFLVILSANIFFMKYTPKEMIFICILGFFLIISYFNQQDMTLIRVFLLVVAFKRFDFYKLVKFDFKLKIIGLVIVICLHYADIFENVMIVRDESIRHSLGFIHPNRLAVFVCVIIFQWLVIKMHERKINLYKYLCIIIVAIITDIITGSRTILFITLLGILVSMCFYYIPTIIIKKNILNRIITVFIAPLCALMSYYSTVQFDSKYEIWMILDDFFSRRISMMNSLYNSYGVSIFGQEVYLVSARVAREQGIMWIVLDNAYMALAIRFGIIILILFLGLSVLLQEKLIKNQKFEIVMVFTCFAILGLTELQFYMIEFNFSLFAFIFLFQPNSNFHLNL